MEAAGRPPRARRAPTDVRIVEAAERLFAEHGISAVSFRQIAAEVGSSNNVVVQYHFGDKLGLVRAIFERRLPSMEIRCGELLAQARRDGKMNDPRTLAEVILRPLVEERDEFGRRSYAAFLEGLHHFEGSFELRMASASLAPLTSLASDMLQAALPHLPKPLYLQRMAGAASLFHRALVDIDREKAAGRTPILPEEETLRDTLDLVAAAMTAPVAPSVLKALG